MMDEQLKKQIKEMMEGMKAVQETLELADKITEMLDGKDASIAIPASSVVTAKLIFGCCESKQDALATLALNTNKTYELLNLLFNTAEQEAEDASIQ